VAFLLLTALLALGGFWDLYSTFKFHDDEGYVLLSLQNFSQGGALYRQVYSQYGPLFFLFNDGLHRLAGFEFSHNGSRFLTLF
jgi:hypothetical protein